MELLQPIEIGKMRAHVVVVETVVAAVAGILVGFERGLVWVFNLENLMSVGSLNNQYIACPSSFLTEKNLMTRGHSYLSRVFAARHGDIIIK